ncbi:MAG: branched-chain amino acid aminotransferase [Alphaproteobacteria bacterium]
MQIVPFDKRDGFIWFNGKIIPWQDATIHILNHGLHYASSVFEGERAYNGKIFESTKHSQRLINSAQILDMDISYSAEELDLAKHKLLEAEKLKEAYVRPVIWRGSEVMTISAKGSSINVAIACWQWPKIYGEKKKGIRVCISDWIRPDARCAPTAAKAGGLYMICTLSKHKAESRGYDDALMLDYRGYIAEVTVANFFLVINGELHTPIADCFLNGITRQTVMELARKKGIKVIERYIKPEELANAQEAFITGTAAELTPITEIEDYKYGVGPITEMLMEEYTRLVNS